MTYIFLISHIYHKQGKMHNLVENKIYQTKEK